MQLQILNPSPAGSKSSPRHPSLCGFHVHARSSAGSKSSPRHPRVPSPRPVIRGFQVLAPSLCGFQVHARSSAGSKSSPLHLRVPSPRPVTCGFQVLPRTLFEIPATSCVRMAVGLGHRISNRLQPAAFQAIRQLINRGYATLPRGMGSTAARPTPLPRS